MQELPTEKSEDLILLKERIKYLESESKFLKDIFNKQKLIDKQLENNTELVYHKSYHVPLQYVKVASGTVNGSRPPTDNKYRPVDNNRSNSLLVKSTENKNSNNAEDHGVIKSSSKKGITIVGDSIIKHVNEREVSRDDSIKIRCHPGATTDDIIDYVRPTARKKPDTIIIHTNTNDIQNEINTFQKSRKVLTTTLTLKYKSLSQVSFTVVIKISRKKLKKSTESWRIYIRVKELSS